MRYSSVVGQKQYLGFQKPRKYFRWYSFQFLKQEGAVLKKLVNSANEGIQWQKCISATGQTISHITVTSKIY